MAHIEINAAARVQTFKRKTIKQHLLSSIWDQLSNRTKYTQTVPMSKEKKVPTTVIHKVSDEFNEGTMQTTCLWVGRPQFKPVAGPNKAEGKERKMTTKFKAVHYNVQRFPIVLGDKTVSGDEDKYWSLAQQGADIIKDLYVESTDYDHERSLCIGADEWLTESEYWEDSEYGSSIDTPVSKCVHPNIYVEGSSTKVTFTGVYATDLAAVSTAAGALASTDEMDLAAMDHIHFLAQRTIVPLGGLNGNTEVKWVLRMSDASWYTLTTGASGFRDLMKYTEKGIDGAVTGNVGVYKNMLIMVSQRAPIFLCSASSLEEFQFVDSSGDNRVRAQTTNASTEDGTMEVNALLGLGCICLAEIREADFEKKGFDYNFNEGMCGIRSRGTERTDLDTTQAVTSSRTNESSFLYLTATTTAVV